MTHCEYIPLSSLNFKKSEIVTALPQLYHPSVNTGIYQRTVKLPMSLWCHSAFRSQHILEAVQQWHSKMCQGPISTSLTCALGSRMWIMAAESELWQLMAPLLKRQHPDSPARFLSLFCGRTSVGGQIPPPPHLRSILPLHGPCVGCCSRFTPCLVSQSVGRFGSMSGCLGTSETK